MLRGGLDGAANVRLSLPLRPVLGQNRVSCRSRPWGAGLRRMFPLSGLPEIVTVIGTLRSAAVRRRNWPRGRGYRRPSRPRGLQADGCDYVDREHKPVEALEIEVPLISDAIETTNELQGLTFEEVRDFFRARFHPLPIGEKRDGPIEYKERHLFTDEIVVRMKLDLGLLNNAWSAPSYFTQMLERACRIRRAC